MTLTHRAIALLALIAAGPAFAIPIIEAVPSAGTINVGDTLTVDVRVADPDGFSIGSYDILLSYDSLLLSVTGVSFGTALDGPADSIQGTGGAAGVFEVYEVSLGLLLGQDGSTPFSLFTVSFDALAVGVANLALSIVDLSDAFGGSLESQASGASVLIEQGPPVTVPEPGSLSLLVLGIACLARRRLVAGRKPPTTSPRG